MNFLIIIAAVCFPTIFRTFSCESPYPAAAIAFFYGPERYTEYFSIEDFENIKLHPAYDYNRPSVFYIHGFRESVNSESVMTIVSAYLIRDDHNIFAFDWSNYSTIPYAAYAVPNAVGLGYLLGTWINKWIDINIISADRFHIVGHSLGGQMAGYIGKIHNYFTGGKRKMKRITALDPAKPLFYTNITGFLTYIHKSDAVQVDIIHTNAGILGSGTSLGDCDFWPNGGIMQSGCMKLEPSCDHSRSWMYYAESVRSTEPNFHGIECRDYDSFKNLTCNDNNTDSMGFHASENCSGIYYLQTNSNSPFSRGVFGLQYSPLADIDRQNDE